MQARRATLAVLALGLLATLAANLPGQMSWDSVGQLLDGRTGVYHPWHPVVMAWLLGLGDAVLPGTALYMTAVAALGFGALALIVADAPRVGWGAPVVAAAACASPLLLLEQGIVWKDVLFADATVAAFALLASAARERRTPAARWKRTAAATGLLILVVLVRQNGALVAVFGAAAAGWVAACARPDLQPPARWRRAVVAGVGVLVVVLAAAATAQGALMTRGAPDDPGAAGQLRLLKLYDLVGVARRAPQVDLSPLHATGLDAHIRAAAALYTPLKNDTLVDEPGIAAAIAHPALGLDAAWRSAVLHQPAAWLAHRLDVFRWIWAPPDVSQCTATYTGVDGPSDELARLGLRSAWRAQDLRLSAYAQRFVPTPLYSHAAWTLVALVLAALLAWRRSPADGVMLALMAGALAYAASFLAIGIACDHRYLYALDFAAIAALLHVAADPPRLRRAEPRGKRRRAGAA